MKREAGIKAAEFESGQDVATAHDELLTIGELARRAGRRASSIRYYERIGLLPEPIRISGQRRYREDCLRTLVLIDVGQRAGLSLEQIKAILDGPDASGALRHAASERLPELMAEINRADLARRWLELASLCHCHDLEQCPLFNDGAPWQLAGREITRRREAGARSGIPPA